MSEKQQAILLIFGDGGHRAQMCRLLELGLIKSTDNVDLICFFESDGINNEHVIDEVQLGEVRSKHSILKSLVSAPIHLLRSIIHTIRVIVKYHPQSLITTGPGLAVIPGLVARLFGVKIVLIEDWCKFEEPTLTCRMLAPFSDLILVQNKSLLKQLPSAKYTGRL